MLKLILKFWSKFWHGLYLKNKDNRTGPRRCNAAVRKGKRK